MHKRPDWDETFLDIVEIIGRRGTCNRGRSGCVITRNNRIISTGYVGAPSKMPHCDDSGHDFISIRRMGVVADSAFVEAVDLSIHCIRSIHSEMNAILSAARNGIKLEGATLYCTMVPCSTCAKNITSTGIKRVVCLYDYQMASESKKIFEATGIEIIIKNPGEMKKYER